jgi:DNA topoisomerase-1
MTEINCFDIIPDPNVSEEELKYAIPELKNYVESLYTGEGKIEDTSKIPIAAFFSNRIDKIQICVIGKLAKKYKEHINRINKEITKLGPGKLFITLANNKRIRLGIPYKFSPIEVSKLGDVIDQFGSDEDVKKKKPRFGSITTKGSFFDEEYPYDDLLFDYDGNGQLRRALLYYTGTDKVKQGYELTSTEHEIASLFGKELHMKINGDKGYFSDKASGKAKKTKAQKDQFIKNFWHDFTQGVYYKRKIKQPCVSCDGKASNKYCWAKNLQEFNNLKPGDFTVHRYMRQSLSKILKNYEKADFNEFVRQVDFMNERKVEEREFKKGDSPDKIQLRKDEIIAREEKKHNRTYALVDGRKEPLGKVTPMLLRLFKGDKSSLYKPGQITSKVDPEDCILNICGGNIPKPPPGRCWGAVVCDPTVKIVVWFKPIFDRKGKIQAMSDGDIKFGDLSLISSKDKMFKFEKARKLNKNIDIVRRDYSKLLESNSQEKQQLGVIIYLLDHFGFRGGSEEDKDSNKEEDGIGVTTLYIKNIKSITDDSIHLNFKGKSGIEFDEKIIIPKNISRLIQNFIRGAPKNRFVFNLVDLDKVNRYLQSIDSLFSAKVFRTRLASQIMYDCLNTKDSEIHQGDDKKLSKQKFDNCNMSVALALNHKKKATLKQEEKLKTLKEEIETLKLDKSQNKKLIEEKEKQYKRDKQLWEVNLGTSIKNYIDPRIIVAWAKNQSIDWDDNFDGKTKTVNNIDDLYLLPQMKFVKAKTEEEEGGAVNNPEFVWAIESVDNTWNWDTSPLLIPDTLHPKEEDSSSPQKSKPTPKSKPSPKPKPPPKPRPSPKPKLSLKPKPSPKPMPSDDSESSSDSEDDLTIAELMKRKQQKRIYKYLENIPGENSDFKLLAEICKNPTVSMKRKLSLVNPLVIKWLQPFCLYALNLSKSPQFNESIIKMDNYYKKQSYY